jgi:phosphoglycolate phosphatase
MLLNTEDSTLIEEAVRLYRERYNSEGVFEYEHYRGVEEMLDTLRRARLKLWVVSSKAAVYLPTILRHLKLESCFEGSYGPDLSGKLTTREIWWVSYCATWD